VYLCYIPFWKHPPNPCMRHSDKGRKLKVNESSTSFESLKDHIRTLPRKQRRHLSEWKQTATDIQVWRAFRSRKKLRLATDGGLSGRKSTHGWVLATDNTVLFTGAGPVNGPFDLTMSTRSKLGGLAASLLLFVSIAKMWGTQIIVQMVRRQ
jgi:hypothetical protein